MEKGGREALSARERISKVIDLIPPATALKEIGKVLNEKRIRIKYNAMVKSDSAKLNSELARMLGIVDKIELVVAGRAKFVLNAIIDDNIEMDRVHVNPEVMAEEGVADNSLATIRAYRGRDSAGSIARVT